MGAAPPDERLLQAVRVIGSQLGQYLKSKRSEEAVHASEARFRSLTALSSDWYREQDENFRFIATTRSAIWLPVAKAAAVSSEGGIWPGSTT